MFDKLRAYCKRQTYLAAEEYALMQTILIPKKFKKGEFLLREGEVAKYGPDVQSEQSADKRSLWQLPVRLF